MRYTLAPNITYCIAGDRYFFLDLHDDRYTCLGERAQRAFIRLEADLVPDPIDVGVLDALAKRGILSPTGNGAALNPCEGPAKGARSIHRRVEDRVPIWDGIKAAANLHCLRRSLVHGGLEAEATAIRVAKGNLPARMNNDFDRTSRITRAYEVAGLAFSLNDNCLLWSLALAKSVINSGSDVNVVLAVMARPFMAHCWAQIGDTILNDEVERTEQFTPILVI